MSKLNFYCGESKLLPKRVLHYYKNIANRRLKLIWHHFKDRGIPRATIYKYILKHVDSDFLTFKKGGGPPKVVMKDSKLKQVEKFFMLNQSTKVATAARKINVSVTYLQKFNLHKLGIVARVKKSMSKYIKHPENHCQKKGKKLYREMSKKIVVMDNETYVILNPAETPGRKFFHSKGQKEVKYEEKTTPKTKFLEKKLVWQALVTLGKVSAPFTTKGTIHANIGKNECPKKRLISLICKHHKIEEILFWSDVATAHYANDVTRL